MIILETYEPLLDLLEHDEEELVCYQVRVTKNRIKNKII